jgi:hypothetical protein
VAALSGDRCELIANVPLRDSHYQTVACSGKKARGNGQSCVGYSVCFGTRGAVWGMSCDVKRVQEAGGVLHMGQRKN